METDPRAAVWGVATETGPRVRAVGAVRAIFVTAPLSFKAHGPSDVHRTALEHPGRAPHKQGDRLRSSIKDMQGERPFFHMPTLRREHFTRATVVAEKELVKVKPQNLREEFKVLEINDLCVVS